MDSHVNATKEILDDLADEVKEKAPELGKKIKDYGVFIAQLNYKQSLEQNGDELKALKIDEEFIYSAMAQEAAASASAIEDGAMRVIERVLKIVRNVALKAILGG